ncbi:MAG TPA: hypothetical protein VKY45_04645, partial [Marinilabiliaceae bacterium]|nr:hypothetical protein [Marinilabiliaceae bacterium]
NNGHDVFKNTETLYSRTSGDWSNKSTWSTESHTGSAINKSRLPTAEDLVIVGAGHTVTLDGNSKAAAQIEIKEGATLDIRSYTGHNFTDIKGGGKFRTSTATLPTADFGDFVTNETAIFEYYGGAFIIPNTLRTYPNLLITGTGAKTSPSVNLKVRSLTLDDSGELLLNDGTNGNISVEKEVQITSGTLTFKHTGTARQLTILGDLSVTGGAIQVPANTSAVKHQIYLYGNLNHSGGDLRFSRSTNSSNITLSLLGNNTVEVNTRSVDNSDLYRVIVNKPSNKAVAFNNGFSLSAPTNGDVKSLVLQSGIAQLNSSNINLTLSSGGADFKIPSVAALQVFEGSKVTVSGTGTGIWLDGSLEIDYGTSANRSSVLCDVGSNNYIEFTSSGKSSITVGDYATLQVGSQIRRNSVSEEGALTFLQTKANSIVKIGTKNSLPVNHRGVFEMMGAGSSFKQSESDSKIEILNSQDSGTFPALFFNPANVEIAANSRFIIGGTSTPPDKVIDIYAGKPIRGLTVAGDKKARLVIGNLTLLGDLDIQSGAELLTSNLDLSIHGNFNSSGTYSPGFNTTSFVGTGNQTITGNPTFYNLTKKGGTGSLTISNGSSAIVSHNLSLEKGLIESGASTLQVKGNAHVETETFLSSLTMNGAELQLLSGGGVMGKLIVNNTHGVSVPSQTAPITVKDKLSLKAGVLNIGQNLLDLLKEAEITGIDDGIGEAAFSTANMIQTFVSFTDAGVRKWFPSISSPYTFIYPVGSEAKYTPVTMNITGITSTNGSIRVKAANERHVSITDRIETPFNDMNNVLQYYWTMDAEGIKGFKAEVRMKTYPEDVKVDAPDKTAADYITARILANSDKWVPGTVEGFDEENSVLIFNDVFTGTDDLGIDGDYTAGLPDAVPERIPAYISVVENGNWNDASTWATYNPQTRVTGLPGVRVQQGGPVGNIVYINKSIGLGDHNRRAFRTHIMADATLDIGSFVNNRLGNVDGTGRLKVETGTLPAGFYDDFVKSTGGTIQYSGSTDYTVMGESTVFNNVEFTGTGNRTLPSINISLNGKLVVNGPKTVINKNLTIAGDLIFNGGEISSAIGSKIILSGTQPQLVGGTKTFTGDNAFQNVTFNNSNKVTLNTNVEVKKNVELVRGMVYTSSSGLLTILDASTDALSGTTSSRYIEGPLVRQIDGTTNRVMPIGKSGRYGEITLWDDGGGGLWRAEYFNAGPADRSQVTDPIKYVSTNEYWQVQSPTLSHSGKVTLRWDAKSGVNHEDINFKVVSSTSSANWKEIGFTNKVGTISAGTLRTVVHSFQKNDRFTFGSSNIADFTWLGTTSSDWFTKENWSNSIVPSAANNVIINYADSTWPVIKGENVAHTNDLTISSGKKLEVGSGGKLTVEGDLNNNGELVLNSTHEPNGLASLITYGTVTGNTTVALTLPTNEWYYLSSPMKNVEYSHFGNGAIGAKVYGYRGKNWQEVPVSPVLSPLEGALTILPPSGGTHTTLSYSGEINTETVVHELKAKDYYLFGNPYPSSINWQDEKWERNRIYGTIWYRTRVGAEMAFVTYNRFADPDTRVAVYPDNTEMWNEKAMALIPPYQSVWIYSKTASADSPVTLRVSPEQRVHGVEEVDGVKGATLKSSKANSKADIVRLVVQNESSRDGTVIYFSENTTNDFDLGDSPKYFNGSVKIPEVYTRSAGQSLAINGLAPFEGSLDLPLSVRNRVEGPVDMHFDLSLYRSDDVILLHDQYLDVEINLREVPQYRYEPTKLGDSHDRFVIRFNPEVDEEDVSTSNAENLEINLDHLINITGANGRAIVSIDRMLLQEGAGQIEVFNVSGAKINEFKANTNKTFIVLP